MIFFFFNNIILFNIQALFDFVAITKGRWQPLDDSDTWTKSTKEEMIEWIRH